MPDTLTRRRMLAITGGSFSVVAAGCMDDDEDDDDHDEGHDHGDDDGHGHDDHDHVDVEGLSIVDRDHDEETAYIHDDHWHGSLPAVEIDHHVSLGAVFEDDDGHEIAIGSDEDYQLNASVIEGADDIVSIDSHGDHVHVTGEELGVTFIEFHLWHDDHADWTSPDIEVQVVEDAHGHHHEEDHDEHDH